jgi:hypothetical protein
MRQMIEDTAFMLKLALIVFVGQGVMFLVH